MAQKEKDVRYVPLAHVIADKHQPRRNFNPARLADLMKSITKHGIISPLLVEKRAGGTYLLVDGERRLRAATQLGLKEVPVNIREEQKDTERLIEQFHIQEQHEGWSALEKAVAVFALSQELKIEVTEIAEILNLPRGTISDYMAFATLADKKEFEKSEVSLTYAPYINRLTKATKKSYSDNLEKDFSKEDVVKLEKAIIDRIKDGSIVRRTDITKIIDVVKTDPEAIQRFIKDKSISPDKLFIDSSAKGARSYRNIIGAARNLAVALGEGEKYGAEKFFEENDPYIKVMVLCEKRLKTLISKI